MDYAYLKDILEKKPRNKEIKLAQTLEAKTRFFTDPAIDMMNADSYITTFLGTVSRRLNNPDSFNNFKNNLTFPLKINEFIEGMFSKISNIWQGQNPYYDYSFTSDKTDDYNEYTDLDFFKSESWDAFKNNHNSIILTDLPEIQSKDNPEPFNTIVKINNVIDVLSIKNDIKHVIYLLDDTNGSEKLAVVTNESYQLYSYPNKDLTRLALSFESSHDLGRCPAVWLSQIDFNSKSNIIKSNPISKSLGKIEDLQIIYTLKNILSPYAFYQFIVKYKALSDCTYDDGKVYCSGGYLKTKENDSTSLINGVAQKCPICNPTPGVGDVLSKPIPLSKDEPELKDVIGFISPSTDIMKYGDEFIKNLEADIFDNIVGTDENLNPNENHNETAYKYNVEGQQDVIFRWKSMFEIVISKTLDNVLQLRYGSLYISNNINLGTDFILADLNSLYEEKMKLDELGLSAVFDFNKTIISAKFQNNPNKKRRALIIDSFKPFDESITKIEASYKDGLIEHIDYVKQKYLTDFISWFEDTKTPLTGFNTDLSISRIKAIMNEYYIKWYNEKFKEKLKENTDDKA